MSTRSKEPEEKSRHKNLFIIVNNEEIFSKLDTGTIANILPSFIFTDKKLCELCKFENMLISYGNHKLKREDCADFLCSSEKCKNVLLKFAIIEMLNLNQF